MMAFSSYGELEVSQPPSAKPPLITAFRFSSQLILLLLVLTAEGLVTASVGGSRGGGTPGPFSNPVVKPTRADGTWGVTPWESRTSPGFFKPPLTRRLFFGDLLIQPVELTSLF